MIFKNITSITCGLILTQTIALASPIRVMTTTTDLAMAIKEIGGDLVTVESFLSGTEDPHFADARPDFVMKAAKADIVCFIGLELESGWLPKVLTRSGNKKVQPGGKGHCDVSKDFAVLERPEKPVDRSMGDVHGLGNPHYWLGPISFSTALSSVKIVLEENLPSKKLVLEKNYQDFIGRMAEIVTTGKKTLSREKISFFEYHKDFVYFAADYGLTSAGSIEENPGVQPSAGRLAKVVEESKDHIILATQLSPDNVMKKFKELSKKNVLIMSSSLKKDETFKDYKNNQLEFIQKIANSAKNQQ